MHSITIQKLKRDGDFGSGGTKVARLSVDFVIGGSSLLAELVRADGGHADFMGCFVHGFPAENLKKMKQLAAGLEPDTAEKRFLLYLCP